MLFSEEDTPLLKKWIVKRLENTSDADADVLADYVLALLRHDGDVNTVRALCEAEIPDFLKEDSAVFVQDVFDAIAYKTYAGGAPPSQKPPATFAPPTGPSAPSYPGIGMAPSGPMNGSRKRSYNDRGDGDSQDKGFGGDPNERQYKQPRRGGNAGRGDFNSASNGRAGFQGRAQPMNPQGLPPFPNMPGMPSPPPGMPPIDPNNPLSAMLAMQAMGFPLPNLPPFPSANSPTTNRGPPSQSLHRPRQKQRCRDYDVKGFCERGNTCMFEHGQDSIYVPPANKGEEYDPSNSTLMTGVETSKSVNPGGFNSYRGSDRGRGRGGQRGGDRGGHYNNPNRRGIRAEFSSDKPNHDKTKTTIVVENIPEERFSEDEIRAFFSEFGDIVEVTMRPYKRLAIVKYKYYNGAKDAYNSPKVIFDNRFVKVYWYSDQESLPQPPAVPMPRGLNGALSNGSGQSIPVPARATSEPQIDIEQFTKSQNEVQKLHEEKLKKKQEVEATRKELEKRMKAQAEEKQKLMETIAKLTGKSASPAPAPENGTPAPAETKSTSQTAALKAQLAALQEEAQSLGIDPSAGDDSLWSGRGRGWGRGGYRGRGAFIPRGARGGYRGRGGAPFGAGAVYKLDNRPKTVGLKGVDFTIADNREALGTYLFGHPNHLPINYTPALTTITFKERFEAEMFMEGITNNEVPDVGKIEMSWIQTPLPPIAPAKAIIKAENGDDTAMGEGDAMAPIPRPAQLAHGQEHAENIDYDVADDDWEQAQ